MLNFLCSGISWQGQQCLVCITFIQLLSIHVRMRPHCASFHWSIHLKSPQFVLFKKHPTITRKKQEQPYTHLFLDPFVNIAFYYQLFDQMFYYYMSPQEYALCGIAILEKNQFDWDFNCPISDAVIILEDSSFSWPSQAPSILLVQKSLESPLLLLNTTTTTTPRWVS